jgi:hypothetical protein
MSMSTPAVLGAPLTLSLSLGTSRRTARPGRAAPPAPRHITAQQLLALCLQERQVGERTRQEWLQVPTLTVDALEITAYLCGRSRYSALAMIT